MQFYLTGDDEGILRIEDEEGAEVTAALWSDEAHILSLSVPPATRRKGIGQKLLSVLSQEASKRNIRYIIADFNDSLSDVRGLLDACGFSMEAGAPLKSIDMESLLSSKSVQKALDQKLPDLTFTSLWNVKTKMRFSVESIICESDLLLAKKDFSQFQQDMSGIVFDKYGKKAGFILCSEYDTNVHLDFLNVSKGNGAAVFIAAVSGMINEIIDRNGAARYDKLTYLALNETLDQLLEKSPIECIGGTIYAKKEVKAEDEPVELINEVSAEDRDQWIKEISDIPYAYNICYKSAWYRLQRNGGI